MSSGWGQAPAAEVGLTLPAVKAHVNMLKIPLPRVAALHAAPQRAPERLLVVRRLPFCAAIRPPIYQHHKLSHQLFSQTFS